jgi:hypothetical protein
VVYEASKDGKEHTSFELYRSEAQVTGVWEIPDCAGVEGELDHGGTEKEGKEMDGLET